LYAHYFYHKFCKKETEKWALLPSLVSDPRNYGISFGNIVFVYDVNLKRKEIHQNELT